MRRHNKAFAAERKKRTPAEKQRYAPLPLQRTIFRKFEFKNVVVFSSGAVLGYLIKALIDHYLSKSRSAEDRKINDFNEAADNFRNAFIPVLKELETDQTDRLILRQFFDQHDEARRRFEGFLNGSKLQSFREAWERYRDHCKERTEVSPYEMFATEITDPNRLHDTSHYAEVRATRNKDPIDLINNLLKFAKRK